MTASSKTAVKILVNRFDSEEFIFFDGQQYWADGEAHDEMASCHDLDGLDYGTDKVFEEISRADFDAVVRALRDIDLHVGGIRPLSEAVDRSSYSFRDARRRRQLSVQIHSADEVAGHALIKAYKSAAESYGKPDLFSLLYYLDTHLPHLEKPCVSLPDAEPPTLHRGVRYFQNKTVPLEVVPRFDGRYFFGATTEGALHRESYCEIGPQVVRAIRRMTRQVRDAFHDSRNYLEALDVLSRSEESCVSLSVSDDDLETELVGFLDTLVNHTDALGEFLDKMNQVRRHSIQLERALIRLEHLTNDASLRQLPGYSEVPNAA